MKLLPIVAISGIVAASAETTEPLLSGYVQNPVLAIGLAISLAWIGVAGSWALGKEPMLPRAIIGRMIAAFIFTVLIWAFAERLMVGNNLQAIAVAGAAGLMIDISIMAAEKWYKKKLGIKNDRP